jgi:hypothetical protein
MIPNEVHSIMMGMYPEWRYRWCNGGWCACMGAANCSGNAASQGVTKEQWEQWVAFNPKPDPVWEPGCDDRTPLQIRLDDFKKSK